jgi:DNA-binding CsgD family transcriptional regulator
MDVLELDLGDARVKALMSDPLLLGVWEQLRRFGKPTGAAALARSAQIDLGSVQRAIDSLVELGMVRVHPAARQRRFSTYEATADALRVLCSHSTDRPALQESAQHLTAHMMSLFPQDPFGATAAAGGPWRGYYVTLAHLTAEEVGELRRRLNGVIEFLDLLRSKRVSAKGSEEVDPPLCNYGFTFRADPLVRPALPIPVLRFVSRSVGGWRKGADPMPAERPDRPLSDREYQVALALARGLNQREVAAELGVKPGTVVTLTKRLYRKLGVSRRAELATRLREAYGSIGADAGAE